MANEKNPDEQPSGFFYNVSIKNPTTIDRARKKC